MAVCARRTSLPTGGLCTLANTSTSKAMLCQAHIRFRCLRSSIWTLRLSAVLENDSSNQFTRKHDRDRTQRGFRSIGRSRGRKPSVVSFQLWPADTNRSRAAGPDLTCGGRAGRMPRCACPAAARAGRAAVVSSVTIVCTGQRSTYDMVRIGGTLHGRVKQS